MYDAASALYNAATTLWDNFINIAMQLFKTSPLTVNGSVYSIAHSCFNALASISLPLAIVFFLIAILKEVISSPPEQQARRFLFSALKFGIIVGIIANLWTIMGVIVEISDGITNAVGAGDVSLSIPTDLDSIVKTICEKEASPPGPFNDPIDFVLRIGDELARWFSETISFLLQKIVVIITAFATLILIISSGITILNCAFQRIIKPLVLLPFSTITIAAAAGSGEVERISTSYLKSFFGLCISGAFMIICIKLGSALINGGLIQINGGGGSDMLSFLFLAVQFAVTPLVIAGLIKNVDGMIARFL